MDEKEMSEELNIENETMPEIPKAFATEYIKRMKADTPDLWDRIEAGIDAETTASVTPVPKKNGVLLHFKKYGGFYGMAAAAVLLVVIAMPILSNMGKYESAATPSSHEEKSDSAPAEAAEASDYKTSDSAAADLSMGSDDVECENAVEYFEETDSVADNSTDDYTYDPGAGSGQDTAAAQFSGTTSDDETDGENPVSWEMTLCINGMEYVQGTGEVLRIYGVDENDCLYALTNGLLSMTDDEMLDYSSKKELKNLKENIDGLQNGDTITVTVYRDENSKDEDFSLYIVGLK